MQLAKTSRVANEVCLLDINSYLFNCPLNYPLSYDCQCYIGKVSLNELDSKFVQFSNSKKVSSRVLLEGRREQDLRF